MCPSPRPTVLASQRTAPTSRGGMGCCALICTMLASATGMTSAHAQMVPRSEHFLHQGQTSSVTAVRLRWGSAPMVDETRGQGLALKGNTQWQHWEARIGAVIDRPINPVRDNFVLAQPMQAGLQMRSMHVLSDYYVDGGFRATVGLVSGEAGQAWWSSGDNGGGLNLSVQHIDSLGAPVGLGQQRGLTLPQPNAYVGAGYSTRLSNTQQNEVWRFNADFGLINTSGANGTSLSSILQGERTLDEAIRTMRMRPVLKVSVGYAF